MCMDSGSRRSLSLFPPRTLAPSLPRTLAPSLPPSHPRTLAPSLPPSLPLSLSPSLPPSLSFCGGNAQVSECALHACTAYYYDSAFKRTMRPGYRDHYSGTAVLPGTSTPAYGSPYGQTTATIEEMNRREMVLGPHSRSCGQWDAWEAVFGPKGSDGYPARVWCKEPARCGSGYGQINQTVVSYWREHFDMTHKIRQRWAGAAGLGKKLSGKLHVYVGAGDSFFLTDAVMDLQVGRAPR